jgi:hypothetical protein
MEEITSEFEYDFAFLFNDGKEKRVKVRIDEKTLNIIRPAIKVPPKWTEISNFMCPHCPIDKAKFKYCPLAVNLNDVISDFKEFHSYDEVEVTIRTNARTYYKKTSLQNALGSLLGIVMVANDCPTMGKLKPMMRYHLPFATLEETDYRVLSMYLLAQYVIAKKGGEPDWEMNNLKDLYEEIKLLNQNACRHLSEIESKDAIVNAVVTLNSFAEHVTFLLGKNMMQRLEILFKDYLLESDIKK